ncbi:dihydrofolate reductase [Candidatus Berkelbacteria bacterium]|nr:dihydrofolate reductase [Candidatus Berkelbacteria bacterium]
MAHQPTLTIVAALSQNRVIGANGAIPWDLPDDRLFFRRTTLGKVLILGRKTYESIGRLLPDRTHIILTTQKRYSVPGALVAHTPTEALALATQEAETLHGDEIIVAGGSQVYAAFLPLAKRMFLTIVNVTIEGDAYFPEFDPAAWAEITREHHAKDQRHAYSFDIITYERT